MEFCGTTLSDPPLETEASTDLGAHKANTMRVLSPVGQHAGFANRIDGAAGVCIGRGGAVSHITCSGRGSGYKWRTRG